MLSGLSQKNVQHLIRFLFVGGVCTVFNYVIFYFLMKNGIQYQIASSIGFLSGVAIGFPLNKKWTYQSESSITSFLLYKYALVYLISLVVNFFTLFILVGKLNIDPKIANFISIIITTITNFLGTKIWVFQK